MNSSVRHESQTRCAPPPLDLTLLHKVLPALTLKIGNRCQSVFTSLP